MTHHLYKNHCRTKKGLSHVFDKYEEFMEWANVVMRLCKDGGFHSGGTNLFWLRKFAAGTSPEEVAAEVIANRYPDAPVGHRGPNRWITDAANVHCKGWSEKSSFGSGLKIAAGTWHGKATQHGSAN